MKKRKKAKLFAVKKEKSFSSKLYSRRKLISFILSISLTSIFVGGFSYFYGGSILNVDKGVEWEAQEGDVYFFGLKDQYYWDDDEDDEIKTFRVAMRSEILEVKDLSIDWDQDDDLIIMSSFVFGEDDFVSFEIPNWFDLYHLLITLYNFDAMENAPQYQNATDIIQWATPSAIHFQTSSIYHELNSLFSLYTLGNTQIPIESFENLEELINWIFLQKYNIDIDEDLEEDIIDQTPRNFNLFTEYPQNNSIIISIDPLDSLNNLAQIKQDKNTYYNSKDNLIAEFDLFKYLNETIGNDLDLKRHWYKSNEISFDLEFNDDNMNHNLFISFQTDPFNITDGDADYEGFNGIEIKIKNGYLLIDKAGDYVYDKNILKWRKSLPNEREWFNTSFHLPSLFYKGSSSGQRMKLKLIPNYQTYEYDLQIMRYDNPQFPITYNDIKMHYDCPNDYLPSSCYDYNLLKNRIFRMNNISSLFFNLTESKSLDSIDLIDNIYIKGDIFFQTHNFDRLLHDFYFSQLFLLSFYHTLFFPKDFSFEAITSITIMLNEICEYILGIPNFFRIYDEDETFTIEIPYSSTSFFRQKIEEYLLETFNIKCNGFIEGNVDIKVVLNFDKRVDLLNESYILFQYYELGITRKLGMELIACQDSKGNPKYPEYPAYPDDEWVAMEDIEELKQEMIFIGIIACIITGIASISGSLGLPKLVSYIKNLRRKNFYKS